MYMLRAVITFDLNALIVLFASPECINLMFPFNLLAFHESCFIGCSALSHFVKASA